MGEGEGEKRLPYSLGGQRTKGTEGELNASAKRDERYAGHAGYYLKARHGLASRKKMHTHCHVSRDSCSLEFVINYDFVLLGPSLLIIQFIAIQIIFQQKN